MCSERRATLTTSNMEGSRPQQAISVTLTRMQLYVGIVAQAVAVLTAAIGVGFFLGRIMVHQEFERAIRDFHKVARPSIERMVDAKIDHHYREAEAQYQAEQRELIERFAGLEARAEANRERLERMENKLDWLVQQQRE